MTRRIAAALLLPALALSACGGSKKVDVATYTCAQFTKSLNTKGDNSAGNFINQLRKQAQLGQSKQVERSEISLGIIVTCRGKPGSTRPAAGAIAIAKKVRAGKFHFRVPRSAKKKFSK
jgi:hypothetical protein